MLTNPPINFSQKEEVVDDKANDSGVSPDHYESSSSSASASTSSRRSSSNLDCSLSPGSVGSGDSHPMHVGSYEYGAPSLFQNYVAPPPEEPVDIPRVPQLEDIAEPVELDQAMEVAVVNPVVEQAKGGHDFECPVCQFTTNTR